MQLNEKQQLAVGRAADWYAKQNTQIFKMAGLTWGLNEITGKPRKKNEAI